MKFKEIIGIDMSKITFDVFIYGSKMRFEFKNKTSGFKRLIKNVNKISQCADQEQLYILEHTGMYSHQISMFFTENNVPFVLVPGLSVKKSLGIVRGKDDKIDAKNLATYGYRLREELVPYIMPEVSIRKLKKLSKLRDRLVKQRAGYKSSYGESKIIYLKKENDLYFSVQEKMMKYISKQIEDIEKEIYTIIENNSVLKKQYDLIVSIKGVGSVTATHMIILTEGFTKFKNWRKFSCYAGIAPFPNSSGTSIRGKTKVSHYANKKIKSLLDQCAKCALQYNTEMKNYYEKRIGIGKEKMSTINIIREY